MAKKKLSKQEIKSELWARGVLRWKLHDIQKEMYDIFYNAPEHTTMIWNLARQSGKSYLLGVLSLETCLRKPNSIVKLLSDTKVHVESIIQPLITQLLEDCPEYLKPEYAKTKYKFIFPNGSEIQLAGSDNGHYERLRGQKTDLVLVDEAGFCTNLKYIVRSVLIPTTTHTGGKCVLASTSPLNPGHDFIDFMNRAEFQGRLTKKTIYDNPMLTKEQMESLIEELGGINSPDTRRELFCEIIRDESTILFPELDDELKAKIVREWEKPPHYDAYVGMDLGYKDLTVVVFGYYDFRADKVIIEDEIVVNGRDLKLPELTEKIMETEQRLWTNPLTGEFMKPYVRVSDINYIVTEEISRLSDYQLTFQPANKKDNDAALNSLRVALASERIIIHPRCKTLIRHLTNCRWKNKSSTDRTFARSGDDGHFDAVDAVKYLIRSVSYNRNPYPANYNFRGNKEDLFIQDYEAWNRTEQQNKQIQVFNKIFNN